MIRTTLAIIIALLTASNCYAQSIEGVVSIQCDVGTYVSVCTGCEKKSFSAYKSKPAALTDTSTESWGAHFLAKRLPNGNYTFLSEIGAYLSYCIGCLEGENKDGIVFNSSKRGEASQFVITELPNGKCRIQSALNNKYLARCEQCMQGAEKSDFAKAHVVAVDKISSATDWEIKKLSTKRRCYMFEMIDEIEIITPPEKQAFEQTLLHTGMGVREADASCRFLIGNYDRDGKPDIYVLSPRKASNVIEIQILSGASKYGAMIQQATISMEQSAGNSYEFLLGDYDRDARADLYVIRKNGGATELTIYGAASNFGAVIFKTSIGLGAIDADYAFAIADDDRDSIPDLYAIKKSNTARHKTEIHILSGASGYANYILDTGTGLDETDKSYEFVAGDFDNDGYQDVYAIKKYGAGATKTEVNILSGEANYSQFTFNSGIGIEAADDSYMFGIGDYNGDGKLDLYAIKRYATASKTPEVTILDGQR